jgi:hypothetical protein
MTTISINGAPAPHGRRQKSEPDTDELARDYLAGLVRLLSDDVDACRVWHGKVPAEAFASAVDGGVFHSIGAALRNAREPNLLTAKAVIVHDDRIRCAPDDAVALLFDLYKSSIDRPYHLWIGDAAERLALRHRCRMAADLGRALASTADAGTVPDDAELEDVIRRARQIQLANRSGDATSRDLLSIIDRWKRNSSEKLLRCGFPVIDKAFGGGLPVGAHGIAAKPTTGKSAIAGQIALGALLENENATVSWFRGEMTDDLLFSKWLACWSRMRPEVGPAITLRDALHRSPESKQVYLDLANVVGNRLVTVDPPLSIAAIEQHIDERKPSLAVIDYLQLCEAAGFKDRRAELDHIVARISMLATRHDIPLIVVSAVAQRTDRSSEIGTLTKESNRLDFDAHTYISLWPDGPTDANPRKVLLRINKSRTGQQRDDELWFHGANQFFQAAATYAEFDEFALPARPR